MKELQYIKNGDINFKKWDQCIENAPNTLLYANSWYLNIVSPNWDAIIYGDYEAVFPLCVRKKIKLSYIAHPLFTQQLGIFGMLSEQVGFGEFIKQIPRKFLKMNFQLNNYHLSTSTKEMEIRRNSLLPLSSLIEVKKKFNQGTNRNIKKFDSSNLSVTENVDIDDFLNLKKGNVSFNLKDSEWGTMKKIITDLTDRKCGETIGIYLHEQLVSGVFFAHWSNRIYYLFSASNARGKEMRASFGIVYYVINKYIDKGKILDFEGSMNENIARFFQGFGAEQELYYLYKKGIIF